MEAFSIHYIEYLEPMMVAQACIVYTWSNQKNEKDDRSEEVGSGNHTAGSHHNLIETLRFTDER